MTKKNNEVEVVETAIKDVETMPINSNDVELPKRKGFFSKRDKTEKEKGIHKNELSSGAKKSMRTRIISAIVGLAIVVPAIFLGDWIYFAVISIALLIACYEILGCTNKRTVITVVVYFIFVALIAYWPLFKSLATGFKESKIDVYYNRIYLPITVVILGIFLVFFLTVIYKDFTVHDACFLFAMAILVGLGFQCLFYLRYVPIYLFGVQGAEAFSFTVDSSIRPSMLLIFVIISTFMTDTGAYFVGVFFGKNKMNERISPKKTWEGFVGGVVISFVLSCVFGFVSAACGFPIHPALSVEGGWYLILILSLLVPLFATLGDFVFSSIKRYWGIKDYGKLIPGHGGVLDRLDSILFSVIFASIFIFMLSAITKEGFNWEQFLV